MPHKRNPVAQRPHRRREHGAELAATIFAAQVQDHERSAGPWHAEWPTLRRCSWSRQARLAAIVDIPRDLESRCGADAVNLDATGGLIMRKR